MRKVLLATTALVAMSVTAAKADITISGSQAFDMEDDGTTTVFTADGALAITGKSVTDSGLTLTASVNTTTQTGGTEDSYLDIAGEFGSIRMGDTDNALDRMDGALPSNFDIEGVGDSNVSHAIGDDVIGISFISPAIGGATVYGSTTAEGEENGMGINYAAGPVTVMYQMGQDGNSDETAVAVNFTMGDITVGAGAANTDVAGTKTKYRSMGIKYSMGDISLVATSQKKVGGDTYSNVGASYTVAPGLKVAVESAKQASTSATWASVSVAF